MHKLNDVQESFHDFSSMSMIGLDLILSNLFNINKELSKIQFTKINIADKRVFTLVAAIYCYKYNLSSVPSMAKVRLYLSQPDIHTDLISLTPAIIDENAHIFIKSNVTSMREKSEFNFDS